MFHSFFDEIHILILKFKYVTIKIKEFSSIKPNPEMVSLLRFGQLRSYLGYLNHSIRKLFYFIFTAKDALKVLISPAFKQNPWHYGFK